MDITFIIPVLNGEKYIHQCLESILSEMISVDEVIVVDNGSTDKTVEIVETFENAQLLILPGLTVSALRNRGAALSSKSLLAFIDADCILCKGWRQQVVDVFKDESVDATGSLYDIPENACWIEKAWFSQKISEKARAKYINSGNLIVRRRVFDKSNGFDETLVSDEDCDFGERLNAAGYFMLEDPDIRVIHLGNPKSLKAFYLKEAWHATSVLSLKSSEIFNRPTIMSILFGITVLVSMACIAASIWANVNLFWVVSSVLVIPFFTAIYRAYQFEKYRYIPELTLLWGIFYLVRVKNMLSHFFLKPFRKVYG